MDGVKATQTFIILVTLVSIAWDVSVCFLFGQEATISRVLWRWSHHYSWIRLAVGALIGHIFLAQVISHD